jgi:hypothetical protein
MSHDAPGESPPGWRVTLVLAGDNCLDEQKWGIHVTPNGPVNDAVLTLNGPTSDELDVLDNGGTLMLAVRYKGQPADDTLYVAKG